MSLKLDGETEIQLKDRFGQPLKEGTEVLINGYKASEGFLEGEILSITDKCVFVATKYTREWAGGKLYRRRVKREFVKDQIINLESINELIND